MAKSRPAKDWRLAKEVDDVLPDLIKAPASKYGLMNERPEIMQEAKCRASLYHGSIDELVSANNEDGLKRYLKRVVRNVCVDLVKRARRWKASSLSPDPSEIDLADPASREDECTAALEREDLLQALRPAMETLTCEHQAVLSLRIGDLSYKEISRILGLPSVASVTSRLSKARAALKKALPRETLARLGCCIFVIAILVPLLVAISIHPRTSTNVAHATESRQLSAEVASSGTPIPVGAGSGGSGGVLHAQTIGSDPPAPFIPATILSDLLGGAGATTRFADVTMTATPERSPDKTTIPSARPEPPHAHSTGSQGPKTGPAVARNVGLGLRLLPA